MGAVWAVAPTKFLVDVKTSINVNFFGIIMICNFCCVRKRINSIMVKDILYFR